MRETSRRRKLPFGLRGIFLVTMTAVTAWSVWVWGQSAPGQHKVEAPKMAAKVAAPPHAMAKADEAEGTKEAENENEGPAPFNWTDFGHETPPYIAMLINFGILAAGYYLMGKKPIVDGLKTRRDTIAKEIEEAQAMKHAAEERAKKYQAKLEVLEQEVAAAREGLVRSGEAERDRIVKEAEAKAERMRKDAQFLVEQEMKQIRIDLWRDAVDAAVIAAEELLKKRVTPADQERLAEEYLAELGTGLGSPS